MSIQSFERRLNFALAAVEVGGSVLLLSALSLVHFIRYMSYPLLSGSDL